MNDRFSIDDMEKIKEFIEEGKSSPIQMMQAWYREVLFNSGTPFVGDSLLPFIPVETPIVSRVIMASDSDFTRG